MRRSRPASALLVAARAVQGLGAAILVPCSLILLSHAFPAPADRSRAVGLWAAGASVALSGGPLVGGALIAALGWRAIFFINVPIGILGIWLTLRFARETPRAPDRGVDVPGQSAAVLALATLAAATIAGGQGGWGRPGVIAGYAVAAVAFAAFLLWEARSARPMLPLGLFRDRTFSAAAAIGLLLNIAFYGLIFVLSLFFQRDQGRSALATGLAFAPMTRRRDGDERRGGPARAARRAAARDPRRRRARRRGVRAAARRRPVDAVLGDGAAAHDARRGRRADRAADDRRSCWAASTARSRGSRRGR